MIILEFPPSANMAYPNNGRRHMSKEAALWKTRAMWTVQHAFIGVDIPQRFVLKITLWFPDNRKRDVDNYAKLPKDTLCDALAIDDNWHRIPMVIIQAGGIDKKSPRCEMVIDELICNTVLNMVL